MLCNAVVKGLSRLISDAGRKICYLLEILAACGLSQNDKRGAFINRVYEKCLSDGSTVL